MHTRKLPRVDDVFTLPESYVCVEKIHLGVEVMREFALFPLLVPFCDLWNEWKDVDQNGTSIDIGDEGTHPFVCKKG